MEDLLPGAMTDLMNHGLDAGEIGRLLHLPRDKILAIAAGGEAPSMNPEAAVQVGMLIALLNHMQRYSRTKDKSTLLQSRAARKNIRKIFPGA